MQEYLEIGQIVGTHGIKGFMKVKPLTDDIKRFSKLKTVYISTKTELVEFEVQEVKYKRSNTSEVPQSLLLEKENGKE